jgi:UDP-glucose 4-epimerase
VKLVVTGGCGFIGRNLIASARERRVQVRVIDDLSAGTSADLDGLGPVTALDPAGASDRWSDAIQVLKADVRDLAAMERVCRDADAVVHLAANTGIADSLQDPLGHAATNVMGTLVVLEACRRRGVRACVVASSGAAVGEAPPPMREDLVPNPISPYGASKLAAEAYCLTYRSTFGLSAVALRFSNVYGPHSGHKTSVVARFIATILEGSPLTVYGDGRQTRDFLFVRDLTAAVWAALEPGRAQHGVYQIGSGVETAITDLLGRLADLAHARLGRRPRVEHRPARAGEVARNFADPGRARRELGWTPTTQLDRGLAETFDWFLARQERATAR